MPIPAPGQAISINTIVTEFGGTAPHAISEYYRGGPRVANAPVNAAIPTSGQIALSNFYGASNRIAIPLPITGVTTSYNVYNNRGPTYVPGISDITVTVGPAGVVGGSVAAVYAMLVPNEFSPTDTVNIVNNGIIAGAGGDGGLGGAASSTVYPGFPTNPVGPFASPGANGVGGANGIFAGRPVTITNNGTIAGGGGGGGGGPGRSGANASAPVKAAPVRRAVGGGGGGGGGSATTWALGGGAAGGTATMPAPTTNTSSAPGFSGSNGGVPAGGAGGPARPVAPLVGGRGGAGGSAGAAGSAGTVGSGTMTRTQGGSVGSGGAAGNYIVGNPFVTWAATGTRIGGVA